MLQQTWGKMWEWHDDIKSLFRLLAPSTGTGGGSSKATSSTQPNPEPNKRKLSTRQLTGLWLGPVLFLAILLFLRPEDLSPEAVGVLASTAWIATWWITEAIPIPATSLLPIVLFPLTGAMTDGVTSAYGDPNIFLFMGGFVIAIAMEKWNLHKRIALNIILVVGTSTSRLVLGFMVATGFLSLWISNTATAMMMMPIALAVIAHVSSSLKVEGTQTNFGKALMLAVAYSASIGGLGTLIGTPPNAILASTVNELYGIEISFATWMLFGVPIAVILLAFTWFYLVRVAFPLKIKELPGGKGVILDQRKQLGAMSYEEKWVMFVFVAAAFSWITRSFFLNNFLPTLNDTIIAITFAVLLFLLPSRAAADGRIVNWDDAKKLPWGILLLFGGGLAIAAGFRDTGLAVWIGDQLTGLAAVPFIFIIAAVTFLVLFLTEITSNTATGTMMMPIMASLALAIDVHPYTLMVAAGVAASCAFMLPVATPPNAIVFGSGYIEIQDMVKAGFWINIVSALVITVMVYFLLGAVWGIDISVFPEAFR
ncbi:SLC13 family permease [Bacillus fonticola]|uniref:SLC13 family permease n=1 Tax=Bacillus fonticola TaxID=2728853 RepID=UPI0014727823|nr:DASS family sodium-coupled anion symporter [Bacillus fonticola]